MVLLTCCSCAHLPYIHAKCKRHVEKGLTGNRAPLARELQTIGVDTLVDLAPPPFKTVFQRTSQRTEASRDLSCSGLVFPRFVYSSDRHYRASLLHADVSAAAAATGSISLRDVRHRSRLSTYTSSQKSSSLGCWLGYSEQEAILLSVSVQTVWPSFVIVLKSCQRSASISE